jgi:predicted MPP superfamily phosphohydrolase
MDEVLADGELPRPGPDRHIGDVACSVSRSTWAAERRRIERSSYWISPAGRHSRWRSRAFDIALRVFAWSARLVGISSRGLSNVLTPHLVELRLSFPTLPAAFDGFRILHLTDTHLDALPELAGVGARILHGLVVDLLVHTGDVLAVAGNSLNRAVEPLGELLGGVIVNGRRLAILGNHDPAEMAEALETAGFEVLINGSTTITRQREQIVIIGLDDVHHFYTDAAAAALRGGGSDFRIALVHSPEVADYASAAGIQLYLCGHTHGGQICLPGNRPLVTHLKRCRHAAKGLWREDNLIGYTSSGLGVTGALLRYYCPSEMTVVTLRRGPLGTSRHIQHRNTSLSIDGSGPPTGPRSGSVSET